MPLGPSRYPLQKPHWPFHLNRDSQQAQGIANWWPNDPGFGGTKLYDIAGTNNGSLVGLASSWATGPDAGGAIKYLNNGASYVTFPGFLPPITGPCSIGAWIYPTASNTNNYFISDYGANGGSLVLRILSGKLQAYWNGGAVAINGNTSFALNTWYHVAAVRSGSTGNWKLSIYVNGLSDATTVATASNPANLSTLVFGDYVAAGGFGLLGRMSDVVVSSQAWTPQQVNSFFGPSTRWQLRWRPSNRTVSAPAAPTGNRRRRVLLGATC